MDIKELKKQVSEFRRVAIIMLVLVITSTVFFHEVEKWNWLDSYYYTIITIATVGYGDFSPKTDVGKVGSTVLVVIGIALFTTFASLLLKRRSLKQLEKRKSKEDK